MNDGREGESKKGKWIKRKGKRKGVGGRGSGTASSMLLDSVSPHEGP